MNDTHTLRRPPKQTPTLYSQDGLGENALAFAHYFLPGSGADWYITEYNPAEDIAFGWAEIVPGCGEWGYISIAELEEISLPLVIDLGGEKLKSKYLMRVELDLYWNVRPMREVLANRQ